MRERNVRSMPNPGRRRTRCIMHASVFERARRVGIGNGREPWDVPARAIRRGGVSRRAKHALRSLCRRTRGDRRAPRTSRLRARRRRYRRRARERKLRMHRTRKPQTRPSRASLNAHTFRIHVPVDATTAPRRGHHRLDAASESRALSASEPVEPARSPRPAER